MPWLAARPPLSSYKRVPPPPRVCSLHGLKTSPLFLYWRAVEEVFHCQSWFFFVRMNVSRYIFFTFLCNDRDWACSFRTLHTTSTSCFSRKSPMSSTNKYGKCFDIWRRLWYEKKHSGVWCKDVATQSKFLFGAILQQACLTTRKRWMGVNDIKLIVQ